MNENRAAAFNQVAADVSAAFSIIADKHKLHPGYVVECMTDLLATYVSIFAENPESTLRAIGERVAGTDAATIRLRHFGWKLAAVEEDEGVQTGVAGLHKKPDVD